jgi:hypothetical protein
MRIEITSSRVMPASPMKSSARPPLCIATLAHTMMAKAMMMPMASSASVIFLAFSALMRWPILSEGAKRTKRTKNSTIVKNMIDAYPSQATSSTSASAVGIAVMVTGSASVVSSRSASPDWKPVVALFGSGSASSPASGSSAPVSASCEPDVSLLAGFTLHVILVAEPSVIVMSSRLDCQTVLLQSAVQACAPVLASVYSA